MAIVRRVRATMRVGGAGTIRLRQSASDYFTLTKPNVMILLLITTFCGMLIAEAGLPPLRIIFWTLIGRRTLLRRRGGDEPLHGP